MNVMIASVRGQALKALTPQSPVRVDPSRCVRHRCKRNDCRKCLDVCPSGAITWDERGLQIQPEDCTQCLSCLAVCPTAALQAPEVPLPQVLSDLAEHPLPVLGCHGQPGSQAHARLPCLGYLANAEVMLLLALVFDGGLQVDLTSCRDCPNGHILEPVRKAHAGLSDLKPDHGIRLVQNGNDLEYRPAALSRRDLFTSFKQRSARTAAVMMARLRLDKIQRSFGDKRVPPTRILLLRALAGSAEDFRRNVADKLFGRISFTPTCNACGGCVGVCPTGAIRPAAEGEQLPAFDRAFCVACDSCRTFCREQGVVLANAGWTFAENPASASSGPYS